MGTQHGEYNGEPTVRNQVLIMWELPQELVDVQGEKKPALVSKFYTNSLHENATLRKDLQSWRGKPFTTEELMKFDLEKVLGTPCMVTVEHNEQGKAKVKNVVKLMKGMETTMPPQVNESFSFWLDEFDHKKFAALSPGLQGIVEKSDEYKAKLGNVVPGAHRAQKTTETLAEMADDIPF